MAPEGRAVTLGDILSGAGERTTTPGGSAAAFGAPGTRTVPGGTRTLFDALSAPAPTSAGISAEDLADPKPAAEEPLYYNILGKQMHVSDIKALDNGDAFLKRQKRLEAGRAGFFERVTAFDAGDIPFAGDALGVVMPLSEYKNLAPTFRKLNEGRYDEISDQERLFAAAYLQDSQIRESTTTMGKVGDLTRMSASLGAEMLIGSLLFGAGTVTAAKKAIVKGGGRLVTRGARKAANDAMAKFLSEATGDALKKYAVGAAEGVAGTLVKGVGVGTIAQVPTSLMLLARGENAFDTRQALERQAINALNGDPESVNMARGMSLLDHYIEYVSESAGDQLLGHISAPLTRRVTRFAGRGARKALSLSDEVLEGMGRDLSKTATRVYGPSDAIQDALAIRAGKEIPKSFVGALGTRIARIMVDHNVTAKTAFDIIKRGGFDGWSSEIAEERLGGFLRGAMGVEGDEASLKNAIDQMIPSMEQLKVEAIGFALPMVVGASAYAGTARLAFGAEGLTQFQREGKNIMDVLKQGKKQFSVDELQAAVDAGVDITNGDPANFREAAKSTRRMYELDDGVGSQPGVISRIARAGLDAMNVVQTMSFEPWNYSNFDKYLLRQGLPQFTASYGKFLERNQQAIHDRNARNGIEMRDGVAVDEAQAEADEAEAADKAEADLVDMMAHVAGSQVLRGDGLEKLGFTDGKANPRELAKRLNEDLAKGDKSLFRVVKDSYGLERIVLKSDAFAEEEAAAHGLEQEILGYLVGEGIGVDRISADSVPSEKLDRALEDTVGGIELDDPADFLDRAIADPLGYEGRTLTRRLFNVAEKNVDQYNRMREWAETVRDVWAHDMSEVIRIYGVGELIAKPNSDGTTLLLPFGPQAAVADYLNSEEGRLLQSMPLSKIRQQEGVESVVGRKRLVLSPATGIVGTNPIRVARALGGALYGARLTQAEWDTYLAEGGGDFDSLPSREGGGKARDIWVRMEKLLSEVYAQGVVKSRKGPTKYNITFGALNGTARDGINTLYLAPRSGVYSFLEDNVEMYVKDESATRDMRAGKKPGKYKEAVPVTEWRKSILKTLRENQNTASDAPSSAESKELASARETVSKFLKEENHVDVASKLFLEVVMDHANSTWLYEVKNDRPLQKAFALLRNEITTAPGMNEFVDYMERTLHIKSGVSLKPADVLSIYAPKNISTTPLKQGRLEAAGKQAGQPPENIAAEVEDNLDKDTPVEAAPPAPVAKAETPEDRAAQDEMRDAALDLLTGEDDTSPELSVDDFDVDEQAEPNDKLTSSVEYTLADIDMSPEISAVDLAGVDPDGAVPSLASIELPLVDVDTALKWVSEGDLSDMVPGAFNSFAGIRVRDDSGDDESYDVDIAAQSFTAFSSEKRDLEKLRKYGSLIQLLGERVGGQPGVGPVLAWGMTRGAAGQRMRDAVSSPENLANFIAYKPQGKVTLGEVALQSILTELVRKGIKPNLGLLQDFVTEVGAFRYRVAVVNVRRGPDGKLRAFVSNRVDLTETYSRAISNRAKWLAGRLRRENSDAPMGLLDIRDAFVELMDGPEQPGDPGGIVTTQGLTNRDAIKVAHLRNMTPRQEAKLIDVLHQLSGIPRNTLNTARAMPGMQERMYSMAAKVLNRKVFGNYSGFGTEAGVEDMDTAEREKRAEQFLVKELWTDPIGTRDGGESRSNVAALAANSMSGGALQPMGVSAATGKDVRAWLQASGLVEIEEPMRDLGIDVTNGGLVALAAYQFGPRGTSAVEHAAMTPSQRATSNAFLWRALRVVDPGVFNDKNTDLRIRVPKMSAEKLLIDYAKLIDAVDPVSVSMLTPVADIRAKMSELAELRKRGKQEEVDDANRLEADIYQTLWGARIINALDGDLRGYMGRDTNLKKPSNKAKYTLFTNWLKRRGLDITPVVPFTHLGRPIRVLVLEGSSDVLHHDGSTAKFGDIADGQLLFRRDKLGDELAYMLGPRYAVDGSIDIMKAHFLYKDAAGFKYQDKMNGVSLESMILEPDAESRDRYWVPNQTTWFIERLLKLAKKLDVDAIQVVSNQKTPSAAAIESGVVPNYKSIALSPDAPVSQDNWAEIEQRVIAAGDSAIREVPADRAGASQTLAKRATVKVNIDSSQAIAIRAHAGVYDAQGQVLWRQLGTAHQRMYREIGGNPEALANALLSGKLPASLEDLYESLMVGDEPIMSALHSARIDGAMASLVRKVLRPQANRLGATEVVNAEGTATPRRITPDGKVIMPRINLSGTPSALRGEIARAREGQKVLGWETAEGARDFMLQVMARRFHLLNGIAVSEYANMTHRERAGFSRVLVRGENHAAWVAVKNGEVIVPPHVSNEVLRMAHGRSLEELRELAEAEGWKLRVERGTIVVPFADLFEVSTEEGQTTPDMLWQGVGVPMIRIRDGAVSADTVLIHEFTNDSPGIVGYVIPGTLVEGVRIPADGPQSVPLYRVRHKFSTKTAVVSADLESRQNLGADLDGDTRFMSTLQGSDFDYGSGRTAQQDARALRNRMFMLHSAAQYRADYNAWVSQSIDSINKRADAIAEEILGDREFDFYINSTEGIIRALRDALEGTRSIGPAAKTNVALMWADMLQLQTEGYLPLELDGQQQEIGLSAEDAAWLNSPEGATVRNARAFVVGSEMVQKMVDDAKNLHVGPLKIYGDRTSLAMTLLAYNKFWFSEEAKSMSANELIEHATTKLWGDVLRHFYKNEGLINVVAPLEELDPVEQREAEVAAERDPAYPAWQQAVNISQALFDLGQFSNLETGNFDSANLGMYARLRESYDRVISGGLKGVRFGDGYRNHGYVSHAGHAIDALGDWFMNTHPIWNGLFGKAMRYDISGRRAANEEEGIEDHNAEIEKMYDLDGVSRGLDRFASGAILGKALNIMNKGRIAVIPGELDQWRKQYPSLQLFGELTQDADGRIILQDMRRDSGFGERETRVLRKEFDSLPRDVQLKLAANTLANFGHSEGTRGGGYMTLVGQRNGDSQFRKDWFAAEAALTEALRTNPQRALAEAKDVVASYRTRGSGTGYYDMMRASKPVKQSHEPRRRVEERAQAEFTLRVSSRVPNAERVKAPFKAARATKYIGFGGRSTGSYRYQFEEAGKPVNAEEYSADDVVFVSVNGQPSMPNLEKTVTLAEKALEAGATLLTDSQEYLSRSDYNDGERRLAAALKVLGYERTTHPELMTVGVWRKPAVEVVAPAQAPVAEAEMWRTRLTEGEAAGLAAIEAAAEQGAEVTLIDEDAGVRKADDFIVLAGELAAYNKHKAALRNLMRAGMALNEGVPLAELLRLAANQRPESAQEIEARERAAGQQFMELTASVDFDTSDLTASVLVSDVSPDGQVSLGFGFERNRRTLDKIRNWMRSGDWNNAASRRATFEKAGLSKEEGDFLLAGMKAIGFKRSDDVDEALQKIKDRIPKLEIIRSTRGYDSLSVDPEDVRDGGTRGVYESLSVNKGQGQYKEYFIRTPFPVPGQHNKFQDPNLAGWFRVREYRPVVGDLSIQENAAGFRVVAKRFDRYAQGEASYVTGDLKTREQAEQALTQLQRGETYLEVQEIQGELFQKNRGGFQSLDSPKLLAKARADAARDGGTVEEHLADLQQRARAYTLQKTFEPEQAAFLNLMLKDSTWVPVFTQAITQWAKNQGFTKVRFPTGETAFDVETAGRASQLLVEARQEEERERAGDTIPLWAVRRDVGGGLPSDLVGRGYRDRAEAEARAAELNRLEPAYQHAVEREDIGARAELQRLKGEGNLEAVTDFYEKRVAAIVNRMGAQPVTDANGNTWREVQLTASVDFDQELATANPSREGFNSNIDEEYNVAEALGLNLDSNQQDPDAGRRILTRAQGVMKRYGREGAATFMQTLLDSPDFRMPGVYLHRALRYVPNARQEAAVGMADGTGIEFSMNAFFNEKDAARIALHEFGHVLTLEELEANPEFKAKMTELYQRALSAAMDQGVDRSSMYGLKDVYEFVSESFSNGKFQMFLASIPSYSTPTSKSSIFEELRDLLKDMMKRVAESLGMTADSNLLEETLALSLDVVEGTLRRHAITNTLDQYEQGRGQGHPVALSAAVYQARTPKELMYRLTKRIARNRNTFKPGITEDAETLRRRWRKLEERVVAAESLAEMRDIIEWAQSGKAGITEKLQDFDADTILIWAQKNLPLGMHPRDAIRQVSPGKDEDSRVFNDRGAADELRGGPAPEQLSFEDKLRFSASVAHPDVYFEELSGGMPVGQVGVRTELVKYSRMVGKILAPLNFRLKYLNRYWGTQALDGAIIRMDKAGGMSELRRVHSWLDDDARKESTFVLHAVQLVLDNTDSLSVRRGKKAADQAIAEAIAKTRAFLPAEMTPSAKELYEAESSDDVKALLSVGLQEMLSKDTLDALADYLFTEAQAAKSPSMLKERVFTEYVPDPESKAPQKKKIVLRVPVSLIDSVWQRGKGVKQLVEAGRSADQLTLAAATKSMFDQYERVYDRLSEFEESHAGAGSALLGYRSGYATHWYGRGFLGSVDAVIRQQVVQELSSNIDKEYRRREADYENSYQLTLDAGKSKASRTILDATPRMVHALFGLLGLEYTSHSDALKSIESGKLDDQFGITRKTTYEDTAFRIHEEAMKRAALLKARGEKLRNFEIKEADINDLASFINYMQAQFKRAKRSEYSGRTKPGMYYTFEEAFAQAGLLPESVTAFDAMSRYANDIVAKTGKRILLNQVALLSSMDGQPLIIPEPDTRVSDIDTDQILTPATWRHVLRVARERYGVDVSGEDTVKGALSKIIQAVEDDPAYSSIATPNLASVTRVHVLGGASQGDNVIDVLASRGGGTVAGLMQQVLEDSYHDVYGAIAALERVNGFAKKMNLFGSLFFHKAAFESLTAGTGGAFSLMANPKHKFAVPDFDNGKSWMEIEKAIARGEPWVEKLIELAEESGIQMVGTSSILGIPERLAKTDKAKIVAWLDKAFDPSVTKRVKHFILDMPERNTEFTFETVFATSKLALMLHFMEFEEQKHREAGLSWTHADQVSAMSNWAQYINGEMGGPEAAQYAWYTPRVRQFLNLSLFSFPWTFSAWNAAGGGLITGRFLGNQPTAKETEHILFRRWPAMIAIVMLMEPMIAQLVAYAVSKFPGGDDDDEMKPFSFQNEAGKRMHADITPILSRQPWFDNAQGRRYYIRWGKQGYEILRWFEDPVKALAGKTSPTVHAAFELATGRVLGYPEWELGFHDAGLAGWLTSPDGFLGSRAGYVVQKFVPFSVLGGTRDKNKALATWLGPVSKGAGWHTSVEKMSEILNTWAARRTYDQVYNKPLYKANLEALGADVLDAAERNGLDPDHVLSSARGNVLKDYYAKFYNAFNKNDTRAMEYAAREILRLNGAASSMIRSAKTRKRLANQKLTPEMRTAIWNAFRSPEP